MSKGKKESFNLNDIDSIANKWKTKDGVNWDLIQRMRFMNADAEIDPKDGYSSGKKTFKEK
tara:strand:+ start:1087 stop:1269 length:183 start_codon:yes stop_codon:yes gene_type:complete